MTPRTLAQSVADDLRSRIADGTYPPGSALPPLRDLVHAHGVARGTVMAALGQLVAEGLVSTSQGRVATVVGEPPARPPSTEERLDAIERRLDAAGI